MTRDPRYDILFEPVRIGPVTAKNRFYQVPHCGGMGFNWPQSDARMREMKAEGGWAVVCTEDTSIHPSSDYSPSPQARLWDGYDVRCLALMIDAVHRHDALAGVELTHNGVGRFTSPDTMAGQIRRGVLDLIGAARPSIADPFLPRKIEQGRAEEIRECIGCNICVSGQETATPMRCTQNPTMGEEWRRGWHPENIAPKGSDDSVLIVGAGPAGLEAARGLGQRGYRVALAEATTGLGGRVSWESGLPGLASWARVRDWRVGRIREMANVEVYLDSDLTPGDVLEFGFEHVIVATGARWRKDGVGVTNTAPIPGSDTANVFTPEDIVVGAMVPGPVVLFDDDNFYLGGVMAERLRRAGRAVTLVTTAPCVSSWSVNTMEQHRIQARLIELGVDLVTSHNLSVVGDAGSTQRHLRSLTVRRIPQAVFAAFTGNSFRASTIGNRLLSFATSLSSRTIASASSSTVLAASQARRNTSETATRACFLVNGATSISAAMALAA